MTRILAAAAAAALALAGCASVDKPAASNGAQARAAGGTSYYCWKNKLTAQGDTLFSNRETSASDSCRASAHASPLVKSQIATGPVDVRRCDNGQWVVMVTMR